MAGRSAATTPWKPEHEVWIREHGPTFKTWGSRAAWEAFMATFPTAAAPLANFAAWARHIHDGGRAQLPRSPFDDMRDLAVSLRARATLVTADWHVPYHDAELAEFAFLLAGRWGCEGHVINGDFYDAAMASKFPPSIFGHRLPMADELKFGKHILAESKRRFKWTQLVLGNHEWRWILRLLEGQLDGDEVGNLLADRRVAVSPMSWLNLNDTVRITHPGSASIIPTSVANEIASTRLQHVIAGHGHGLGYRRDRSGQFTVIDSGGLFDINRLDYINVVDKRRPLVNQGFCIVEQTPEGPAIYLFDPRNLDREFWLHAAAHRRKAAA